MSKSTKHSRGTSRAFIHMLIAAVLLLIDSVSSLPQNGVSTKACHFIEIRNPFENLQASFGDATSQAALDLIPSTFEFCGPESTSQLFKSGSSLFQRSSATRNRVTLLPATAISTKIDVSALFETVRVCSCSESNGHFRLSLSVGNQLLAER